MGWGWSVYLITRTQLHIVHKTARMPWGFGKVPSAPLSAKDAEDGCSSAEEEPGCIPWLRTLYIDNFAVLSCDADFARVAPPCLFDRIDLQTGTLIVVPRANADVVRALPAKLMFAFEVFVYVNCVFDLPFQV